MSDIIYCGYSFFRFKIPTSCNTICKSTNSDSEKVLFGKVIDNYYFKLCPGKFPWAVVNFLIDMLSRTNMQIMNDVLIINPMYSDKFDNSFFVDVSEEEINGLLCLYPQEERIIKNCRYLNGKLLAELVPLDISYSNAKPDYYTAEQMIQAISQLGYLIGGLSIKDKDFNDIDSSFFQTYLLKIKNLECYYSRLNIHFIKKVLKCNNNTIEININKANYYPARERLSIDLNIRVGDSFFADAYLITT